MLQIIPLLHTEKYQTNGEGVRQFAKGNLKGGGSYPNMAPVLKVVE